MADSAAQPQLPMAPGGSLVSPGRGLVPRVPAPPPPSQPHGAMLPEGVPPPPNRGAGGFVWLPIAANAMPRGAGAPELPSGVPPPQRSNVGMAPPQHHYPMGAPGLSRPISKKQRADGSTTVRATFSEAQLQGLDAAYAVNAYPSADDRNELAEVLGITPRRVQVWFQNRRSRAGSHAPSGARSGNGSRAASGRGGGGGALPQQYMPEQQMTAAQMQHAYQLQQQQMHMHMQQQQQYAPAAAGTYLPQQQYEQQLGQNADHSGPQYVHFAAYDNRFDAD